MITWGLIHICEMLLLLHILIQVKSLILKKAPQKELVITTVG